MTRSFHVSGVTLIALCLGATVLLTCCTQTQSDGNQAASKTIQIANKSISSSDLSQFLSPVPSSVDAATKALNNLPSLILDGTTLTVGPPGGHQSLTIAADTFEMLNGSRIVTNGNNLVLVANEMNFNNSGGIDSFYGATKKASAETAGLDGGQVVIFPTKAINGTININLAGQAGGDGSPGGKGPDGAPGPKGSDASDKAFGCGSGGGDGGTGKDGLQGYLGKPGAPAGNGGTLVLRAAAIPGHINHFVFQKEIASGGAGGPGGPGGNGGPGGIGGSGSKFCGGGHGGNPGQPGPQGLQGAAGANGKPSPDPTLDQRVN